MPSKLSWPTLCPQQALKKLDYTAPQANANKCIACQKCVKIFPRGALQLHRKPVKTG